LSAAAGTFDTGAAMVSAVAMVVPSNGGDSTAPQGMPQRCPRGLRTKNVAGRGIPATPFARGKKLSRLLFAGREFGCGLHPQPVEI
jgi:hypothetical protein